MKKTGFLFVIISFSGIVFLSCSVKDQPATSEIAGNLQQDSAVAFETFLKTLDTIPLPLEHNPYGQLPELSKNYDAQAYTKYKLIWSSKPLGILSNEYNLVTLIDCVVGDFGQSPYFITFDRQGNKIDSLNPYRKTGEDLMYNGIEYLTICKDKTIVVVDSVISYSLNKDSTDIDEGSRKLTIGLTKYTINTDGYFMEVK